MSDANVAERDAAAATYLRAETDLTTLRKFLRDSAADRRALAAVRLLELTR
jgi:hypothetical protein